MFGNKEARLEPRASIDIGAIVVAILSLLRVNNRLTNRQSLQKAKTRKVGRVGIITGNHFAWDKRGPVVQLWGKKGPVVQLWGKRGPVVQLWGKRGPVVQLWGKRGPVVQLWELH